MYIIFQYKPTNHSFKTFDIVSKNWIWVSFSCDLSWTVGAINWQLGVMSDFVFEKIHNHIWLNTFLYQSDNGLVVTIGFFIQNIY